MDVEALQSKAAWVWRETLLIHRLAPETRVASSLSPVEILVALYYGGILRFDPAHPLAAERDRFIVSKGHGSICLYPILADLGFFPLADLKRVGMPGSVLGGIPDPIIPGYETINGSLGHGLGVACGIALALKRRGSDRRVVVLMGDGELHEGAVWEAAMFAGHQGLDNLTLVLDNNQRCMMGFARDVLDLNPVDEKFAAFGWAAVNVDGHDLAALMPALKGSVAAGDPRPRLVNAKTVKGHGVPELEASAICHVITLKPETIDRLVGEDHGNT